MIDFITAAVVFTYGLLTIGEFYQTGAWQRIGLSVVALLTVVAEAYVLHSWIDGPLGQNLAASHLLALIAWFAAVLVVIGQWTMPVASLGLLVYPVAALSLGGLWLWPGQFLVATAHKPYALLHIILSTLVMGVLVISGCQAMLLAVQEYLLRHKKLSGLLNRLPPLQWMEKLLFRLIQVGVVALSLLILSSVVWIQHGLLPNLWSKILLTGVIWLVLVVLLIGRHFLGWRGGTAVVWTTVGVVAAIFVYLGSHVLLSVF